MHDVAFYSVADRRHFIGVVALVNSIRLIGHREPFVLVDAGLEPYQRELLAGEVTLLAAPKDIPLVFLRPVGPLAHPARVAVLLDADIVVVQALGPLIDAARDRVVAFADNEPHRSRFFPEWLDILGLKAVRPQPYCNAGQLLLPETPGAGFLQLWNESLSKIEAGRTWHENGRLSDPFYFGDQDVFNAIAASALEASQIEVLANRLAPHPPFRGLEIVNADTLDCRYSDGTRPYFLHHTLGKPWLHATRTNVYSRLLPRLLLDTDLAVRLKPDQLPLRLRRSRLAALDAMRANSQSLVWTGLRRQLGRFGIRTRLADWRARREAGRA